MSSLECALETVQDFMAAFIEAWPAADATALGSFFSEDALYQNGPLEPVRDAQPSNRLSPSS